MPFLSIYAGNYRNATTGAPDAKVLPRFHPLFFRRGPKYRWIHSVKDFPDLIGLYSAFGYQRMFNFRTDRVKIDSRIPSYKKLT
jgi:hypothetical protein